MVQGMNGRYVLGKGGAGEEEVGNLVLKDGRSFYGNMILQFLVTNVSLVFYTTYGIIGYIYGLHLVDAFLH